MLTTTDKQTLRKKLAEYEGNIPYMYLDSKGLVTVGVGHMIATAADAQQLAFTANKTAKDASAQEIQTEYDNIKKQPKNRLAIFYKQFTTLSLANAEIDKLTDDHIDSFYKDLKLIYPDFDTYPSDAQFALFDMIFNLGATNLRGTWPTFNTAVKAKDWQKAADNCKRAAPISSERNDYAKNLFESAAKTATKPTAKP